MLCVQPRVPTQAGAAHTCAAEGKASEPEKGAHHNNREPRHPAADPRCCWHTPGSQATLALTLPIQFKQVWGFHASEPHAPHPASPAQTL